VTEKATLTIEEKSLVERLTRRASEPRDERTEATEKRMAKWKSGRSERIESTRKRWDDFDTKRGFDVTIPAQVGLMNQRCAAILENAKTFALIAMESAKEFNQDVMIDVLAKSLGPILKRIDTLEAQFEQRKYFGVWDQGEFKQHNMVTHGGSLWIALCDTVGKPGETDDWQLAVKRGRNAR
jgi:hypothetical protein